MNANSLRLDDTYCPQCGWTYSVRHDVTSLITTMRCEPCRVEVRALTPVEWATMPDTDRARWRWLLDRTERRDRERGRMDTATA